MKIKIIFQGKKIFINVRKANKILGLMFKPKESANLLFEFDKKGYYAIHSFFVFFSFLVLWLDEKNNVVEKRIVKPFEFCVSPKKPFKKIIEIPFNNKNKKIINFIVGKERFK
ncbi:MAG: DUF192 domain-containing protein [Candidatus Pacearchaeota archaeon]|nr:DUF192 domain-containing protein [Candidatus Pacearchaeota archaeon]